MFAACLQKLIFQCDSMVVTITNMSSNLLIVGHLKPSDTSVAMGHNTLYVLKDGSSSPEQLLDADYIDTCLSYPTEPGQFRAWDDVPCASKDILYTWGCPVYSLLSHKDGKLSTPEEKRMWTDLLISGHRILREGGHVIVPTNERVPIVPWLKNEQHLPRQYGDVAFQISNAQKVIDVIAPGMWTPTVVTEYPFHIIDKDNRHRTPLLIFTRLLASS